MSELDRLPLSGLRAVEAVGRLGTLSRSAEELAVTPGAVSQRIAKVEALIGRPLFHRLPGGMVPTELGAAMMPALARAMSDLAQSVDIALADRSDLLTVSAAPLFAGRWLVWRLSRFQQANPDLRIRIDPTVRLVDPRHDGVDICLRAGAGDWQPDLCSELLLPYHHLPVCAPAMAERLRRPADLSSVPVIFENDDMSGWARWLEGSGITPADLGRGPGYGDAGMCIDAALAGQGVFLAWETIAQDRLAAGQLAEPFAPRRTSWGHGLWFVTTDAAARRAPVRRFRDWLRAELGQIPRGS
ncbi:LysR substrate-binding domain-containing protein [Paracoccus pacificus]|uniref:LysR substrate-binding domain-containing protein n=1 Tax=Paracoccus pacificus TaxID=1463598 RepID=A0ABW4RBZ9_9RHOB